MSKSRKMMDELGAKFKEMYELLDQNQLFIDGLDSDLQGINFTTFKVSDVGQHELDLCFSGKKSDFERVWRCLRLRGYTPDWRPGTDKKETQFTTWWRSQDSELVLWMHFTSSECKIRQVGTEMVERPVYEVQCDSELAELGV